MASSQTTRALLVTSLLFLTACATTKSPASPFGGTQGSLLDAGSRPPLAIASPTPTTLADLGEVAASPRVGSGPGWRDRTALLQGYLGATVYETVKRTGGGFPNVDGSNDELSQLPSLGGGAQWKLGGDTIDFGFEGMLGLNWRAGATAIAIGGGGVTVAVDVDLFLMDLYGGPFVSVFLDDKLRLYGAAGPLMQWGEYEESSILNSGSSGGFGVGYYARTGLELLLGHGALAGVAVRWSDSTIDLDGNRGDLDLSGFQIVLTFSQLY